jgi:hypothetical protein
MKTDRLIRVLAADASPSPGPVGAGLALALMLAAPFSIALFMMVLGVRADVMSAMHNPFFDLKFVVTLSLAIVAIAISLHLARPETSPSGWLWLLLIPVILVALGIGVEMMMPHRRPWLARLIGNNALACTLSIPLFALPLLIGALLALRRGAPSRPALTGAVAGLVSAGLGATLYASHCTDDSPLFVATWYSLAFAFVAGVGALAGRRLLRY